MDREDVVKKLFELGVMATPETIKRIEETGMEKYTERIKANNCMVFHESESEDKTLVCSISGVTVKNEVTPEDIIKYNREKYEKIRDFLLRKIEAASINNIKRTSGKVSVIGMVSEKTDKGFLLEDTTGEIEVKSEVDTELDDVIGIRGWVRGNSLFAEEVIYPDIPVNREVSNMTGSLLLSNEKQEPKDSSQIILTPFSMIGDGGKERSIPNPGWVFLERDDKKFIVTIYRHPKPIGKNEAISWFKKRYIGFDDSKTNQNARIIESIPDIFWIVSKNEPWTENYKGVTLVSFGNGHQAQVDLNTRKIELK